MLPLFKNKKLPATKPSLFTDKAKMAPKYNSKYYNLGTYYPQWSDAKKDAVDQALNMIMENSPAGEVLAGKEANSTLSP